MKGLRNWVMNMLKTHCREQFEATMGMSIDDADAAFSRKDKAALNRVNQYGTHMQKSHPEACKNAADWAQQAFFGAGASGNTKTNNNPIERTQYNELQ
jgi:hypothetical protein